MPQAKRKKFYQQGILAPAIAELDKALQTVRTNEPINRKMGNIGQANLERENAKSFSAAMGMLKNGN